MDNNSDIQNKALEILICFDKICKENELIYFLCGGTLLGAVRHKGFIPWDDDIDVSMPRDDYEKFCKIANDILPEHLELHNYQKVDNYYQNCSKVVNKNTTLVEQSRYCTYVRGVFIDIFPIDGAGRKIKQACRRVKSVGRIKKVIRYSLFDKYYKQANMVKFLPLYLLHRINSKRIQSFLDSYLRHRKFDKAQYVAVFVGNFGAKEIMPREVYGNPVPIEFCKNIFNAPVQYNEYLTIKYGNYLELPPPEDRRSGHNFIYFNPDKPYSEYVL